MSEAEVIQAKSKARRARVGQVLSISGQQTVRVAVENLVKHPVYGKFLRQTTKLAVHDANGVAKVGDLVEIVPCRPISKSKAHRLVKVVRSADADNA